ncbi:MAG: DUF4303 domain-containing protein [Methylophilaceae bacterium]
MNKIDIKKQLLNFTQNAVDQFLKDNPTLEYYGFAYDCNAEYAEVNLCFNTENYFEKTLTEYQSKYPDSYKSEGEIKSLKFNPGDWEYQCFDTFYVLTDEELTKIFGEMPEDDYLSWNEFVEKLFKIFCECLIDFTNTESFKKIPKTKGFHIFCIDHDENLDIALERMGKVNAKYS